MMSFEGGNINAGVVRKEGGETVEKKKGRRSGHL